MEKYKHILNQLKFYKLEAIFLGLGIITLAISVGIFIISNNAVNELKTSGDPKDTEKPAAVETPDKPDAMIYVDISGSVSIPDSYEATSGARLKDLLKMAGGLSESADKEFFYKNYNLSKLLSDQEKIYIPSVTETASEEFTAMNLTINAPSPIIEESSNENLVHINTATVELLDTLPSIGATTAQKIIDNRPYSSVDELLEKKAVTNSTFAKIKELIDL